MNTFVASIGLALAVTGATAFVGPANAADPVGPVTLVSHIDAIPDAYVPQSEEKSWGFLRTEMAATKADKGLVSYIVLRQTDGPNHFTIVETWDSYASLAAHQGSAHTVKFRADIQPYLGSPFDARLHQVFE